MRVYVAAFGSGMGHASRMAALADKLVSSGDEVVFSSSGEVTKWLGSRGYRCNDLPLVDVVFTDAGNFSATATLRSSPAIIARLCEQVRREVANIVSFGPDVVVSDSVAASVMASKLSGVRSIAILNQLRLISSPKTPKTIARALTAGSVAFGNVVWRLSEEILVPDLPPPYTISEMNLWDAGSASARAKYVGFLTPKPIPPPEQDYLFHRWQAEMSRRKVFWQVSGPPATRKSFLGRALAAAKALGDEYFFVISAGDPAGSSEPSPIPGGYLYQWCKIARAYIASCDNVISRAGHVSISEYILQAKPSLLVPIQAQTEQMGNASKARRLGIAVTAEEEVFDPPSVRESLRQLESDTFARRAREMRQIAESYDALSSILDVLRRG